MKISSRNEPVEGGKPCERESTNQNRTHGLNRRPRKIREKLVGAIIQSTESCLNLPNTSKNSESRIEMDKNMRKWQKFLQQHPSLNSSSDEIEELPQNNVSLEAITKETKSVHTNTTLSLPSAFKGETIPPVDPNSICKSIITVNPRDPATSNPGDQPTQAPGKKKGTSKEARLVSYSSQDDSQDDTGSIASRRSGRNRTGVTKMGGVMIDFINQSEKEGKK